MLHLSWLTGVLLWFQALSSVRATRGDSGCNLFFCMNITLAEDTMTYAITPIFEPFGWVGLGFGRLMRDTHMIVIWEKEDGSGPILSQRYATGHTEPRVTPKPPRVATLQPETVSSWRPGNYSTVTFEIPRNKTNPREGQIIWAYSLTKPESSVDAQILPHYVAGTVNMDLSKHIPGTPITPEEKAFSDAAAAAAAAAAAPTLVSQGPEDALGAFPRRQKLIWHGILLTVGFLFLLPTGSLVARWSRTFTPRWFKLHRMINFYIALPVILLGWVLGPLAVIDRGAGHLTDAHQVFGVLMLGLYLGQLFLGRSIHAKKVAMPDRPPHPPSNLAHIALGIAVIFLAFLQVRSGLSEFITSTGQAGLSHWCHDAWVAWAILLPVLYFSGLVLLRRQLHQEKQGATYSNSPEHTNYIALSAAPSPMFDADHEMAYNETNVPLLHRSQI
ncbi:hypothetical protein C8J57DRAFT_643308 [Mycena rebaudengoi]|nr:hypothetical protein C8J57DRAFT_643308 [Mycena rebaudengoi]